jgi:hypothetical protein
LRQGERWTAEAKEELFRRYQELLGLGLKKREIVQRLMEDLGRGQWAIVKALKRMKSETETQNILDFD